MARKSHQMPLVEFAVDELSLYHRNPRRGEVSAIVDSLSVNGQYRPVVVNIGSRTGRPLEVLAGNHTVLAARELGWPTVKAVTVDVDDLAAARIVVADNRTAALGSYDSDQLLALLNQLPDLAGTGYDVDALTQAAAEPEQREPSKLHVPDRPQIHVGDYLIDLTPQEWERLDAAILAWVAENGSYHGFVGHLIEANISRMEELAA